MQHRIGSEAQSQQLGETISVSAPTNGAEVEPSPWCMCERALREAGVEDMVRPTPDLGINNTKRTSGWPVDSSRSGLAEVATMDDECREDKRHSGSRCKGYIGVDIARVAAAR